MVILYHNNRKVLKVVSEENIDLSFDKKSTISAVLLKLAAAYSQSEIVWCHIDYQSYLNLDFIKQTVWQKKMMSYNPDDYNFFGKNIGFIDESPFIKINKEISYPTWQMSSAAGAIDSSVLIAIADKIKQDSDFDYYLNSIAKVCMPLGLFCYSEPKLLFSNSLRDISPRSSNFTLFRFVKQHYRTRWSFLLVLNNIIYKFRFPFFALLYSTLFKNRNKNDIDLQAVEIKSDFKTDFQSIDVIIPTIGRKEHLHNILKDLSQQTILPQNIIIVEQNPVSESTSELDYLTSENWPFAIKHTFTHKAGACNARNIALSQIESEWVFFADDDIRIKNDFIKRAFESISVYQNKAVTFSCLQKDEKAVNKIVRQWNTFGSGCSIVNSKIVKNLSFDMKYEFGFGEDSDFGMQIRNHGCDVLYFPNPEILHLKAPIGGFRTKPKLLWENDNIKPKPSPTISVYKILHETEEQRNGYKLILFFKYYTKQSIKNPFTYFFNFKREWKQSFYLADQLIKKA
ncbi:MAG: glycosyltransferase [Flavobacterium sp.]|nr:MAG: glycosyltransferase [Flavobacterium sp.]